MAMATPDIYVANDKTANFLFHNQRDGTFKEIATEAGVAFGQTREHFRHGAGFHDSMATASGGGSRNFRFQVRPHVPQLGGFQFEDMTAKAGISQTGRAICEWGTRHRTR